MEPVVMDEMECLCGEVLRGEKGKIAKQYLEHMARADHQASPAQWTEAYERIQEWKAKRKLASAKDV